MAWAKRWLGEHMKHQHHHGADAHLKELRSMHGAKGKSFGRRMSTLAHAASGAIGGVAKMGRKKKRRRKPKAASGGPPSSARRKKGANPPLALDSFSEDYEEDEEGIVAGNGMLRRGSEVRKAAISPPPRPGPP